MAPEATLDHTTVYVVNKTKSRKQTRRGPSGVKKSVDDAPDENGHPDPLGPK